MEPVGDGDVRDAAARVSAATSDIDNYERWRQQDDNDVDTAARAAAATERQ